jgi:hypothetical protein
MRGAFLDQGKLFSYLSPEARVPASHPFRKIRELASGFSFNQNVGGTCRVRQFRNETMEGRRRRSNYSALILAARISLAHFSASSEINFSNSAGESARTVPPSRSRFQRTTMLLSLMTLPHLASSLSSTAANSAGVLPIGTAA